MSEIKVSGLHKSFGKVHVLRGLDFEVQKGEGVILLGANGCGKSTLMRSICGLTPTDQGEILIQDQSLQKASRRKVMAMRNKVGVVFQKFNLVGNLSVFQNVLYGALGSSRWGLLGCMGPFASQEKREKVMACLERVSLADKADRKAEELSGGQQQRVAIARMLMQEPEIVLADEPIASLDPKSGQEVMELLWDVVQEQGLTVICTLHQLDIALQYGERFIGMKAGQVDIDARKGAITKAELEGLYRGQVRVDAPENWKGVSELQTSAA
ncbi:phosphonate transport system ATP-binding protein [Marinospirillum celere]|uniref:Phosphonate transport system ATP-binding protein n=1 Tax=Marinospirillum celere TaxID=1122252 RepID=A0A1I1DTM8_9GAMM|nr:ATP-binding cassette domain-containing protein [Marinospirillum celere]SFB78241.1 phosphonate transport system ATP-binding protein [Marinospirillum celere]